MSTILLFKGGIISECIFNSVTFRKKSNQIIPQSWGTLVLFGGEHGTKLKIPPEIIPPLQELFTKVGWKLGQTTLGTYVEVSTN